MNSTEFLISKLLIQNYISIKDLDPEDFNDEDIKKNIEINKIDLNKKNSKKIDDAINFIINDKKVIW
ncbi:Uncharacterised protein, partial [Mycoplasmopsis edwardii]